MSHCASSVVFASIMWSALVGCQELRSADGICSTDEGTIQWDVTLVAGEPESFDGANIEPGVEPLIVPIDGQRLEWSGLREQLRGIVDAGATSARGGAGGGSGNLDGVTVMVRGESDCALTSGEARITGVTVLAGQGQIVPGEVLRSSRQGGVRQGFASDDFEWSIEMSLSVGDSAEGSEFTPTDCSEPVPTGSLVVRFEATPDDVLFGDNSDDPDCED